MQLGHGELPLVLEEGEVEDELTHVLRLIQRVKILDHMVDI